MRRLSSLVLLLLCACLALPCTAALAEDGDIAARLKGMIADTQGIAASLGQIRHFREAGFIYQPSLSLACMVAPTGQESWDWRAVVSGMMATDRSYAFFFGTTADVEREQAAMAKVLDGLVPKQARRPLAPQKIAKLQAAMGSAQGQQALAEMTSEHLAGLLPGTAADERSLRFLGAHLYGLYIERIYVGGIMCLAAVEEGTDDALTRVDVTKIARLRAALDLMGQKGLLGDRQKSAERTALLRHLRALLLEGPLNAARLRKAVALCEDVRDAFCSTAGQR